MRIATQSIFRRYDPILECWEDGFTFYRVNTPEGFKWVDHPDPRKADESFDDRDGHPVDCWGEIFGTVSVVLVRKWAR